MIALLLLATACQTPEARAIAYLSAEVPKWSKENRCFSCHHDGDGARALFLAASLGETIDPGAIEATSRWLSRPLGWDRNGGDGPFSDKILARIQFTAALAAAVEAGKADRGDLRISAERLLADQAKDGSWLIDEVGTIGSPATYGRPLAAYLAREALRTADPGAYRAAIARADGYLGKIEPANVDDSATLLLSFPDLSIARTRSALALLRKAESPDGGWGPFVRSPPSTFDSALALLALARFWDEPGVSEMIARGRASLVASQAPDGSWTETTRPTGGESYAQRLSTSAWATSALLKTRPFAAK